MTSRKDRKNAYQLAERPVGICQIRNTRNGQSFPGSSTDLVAIWNRTKFELNMDKHRHAELPREWQEYGQQSFEYSVVS